MCGIAGYVDFSGNIAPRREVLVDMLNALRHRGPDGEGTYAHAPLAMGTRRLSILDIVGSNQPLYNEDGNLILVGNGEIFNYRELQRELLGRGHRLATDGDLEVILHLYEEHGADFVRYINGQFAIALYDRQRQELNLFRDPYGITPLFYYQAGRQVIFASEIKSLLRHPAVPRRVDLSGLDQVLCFPGLVSPTTMFDGVRALRPGHRLRVTGHIVQETEFWDLDYPPRETRYPAVSEDELVEEFLRRFDESVRIRMRSDRPVGVYLSGGLDSSFVAASMRRSQPGARIVSLSVVFPESRAIDERRHQRLMVQHLGLDHVEVPFRLSDTASYLRDMIWHAECPVKESYNVCSMALSRAASSNGIPVILGGEGADELLAGYPGYRFDSLATGSPGEVLDDDERAAREVLWGQPTVRYERMYHQFALARRRFFSDAVLADFDHYDSLARSPVRVDRIVGRHPVHQRSYIDIKLRMADHLLGDHGDRMAMANSVEGRFPFLDPNITDLLRTVPPHLKVRGLEEKVLLKLSAAERVPAAIIRREKFGFRAPASPALVKDPLVEDLLDPARLRRQGYLNEATILDIDRRHRASGAQFNPHAEDDLLMVAITFGLFLELFKMPDYGGAH